MTVEWLVPDGQARSVTMALQAFSADTRTMRGCKGCSVATSSSNGVTVRYTEDWQSEEPLRDHVRSDLFGKLISLIEGSIRPPRIEFDLPTGKRGLDYIAEARRAPE